MGSTRSARRTATAGSRQNADVVYVTCLELPQLDVRDATLSGALYLAEDAIDAILAGKFAKLEGAA